MRSRGTRRAIWVLPALLLVAGAALSRGPSTPAASVDLAVRGSVEQISVTHATPGAPLQLRDANDGVVAETTVDDLGSALWRNVAAGDGYKVVELDGTATGPIHVLSQSELPAQSFYTNQQLGNGFGYITTRDGTKLSVTVKLPGPAANGPYPTVVEYSGYAASNPNAPQPSTQIAQLLGYATVAVNVRGTGCSGGAFSYFEALQGLDGYDVIETVAAQPWVLHGKVGMIGISYPGISQLFVARTQPPHLAAIAPLSVIDDTYRSTLYPGGIFNNGFALDWAKERMEQAAPYGQGWEQSVVDAGGANGTQCAENQLLRHQNQNLLAEIAAHPFYDPALGDDIAPVTFADQFNAPVFLGGAWQDEQTGGHFTAMWSKFATKTKLFATNGTHVDSLLADLNRWYEFLEFYVAERVPQVPTLVRQAAPLLVESQVGIAGYQLEPDRFTGYPTFADALAAYEAEPSVRILMENGAGDPANPGLPAGTFEMGFASWPPPQTQATTWFFQPDQHLSSTTPAIADDDGRASTSYVYDPTAKPATDYTGSSSDIWKATPTYDWKPLPVGKSLAFDTDPLAAETVMAGSGSVDLWLRSSAVDTDVEVTLTEVRPDGQEMYIQSGWLRASRRALDPAQSTDLRPWHTHAKADAQPLPSGEFVSARVELFPFAHVFHAGSKLRITVEAPGGNRPLWTFDALKADGKVVNDVAHSVGHPSKVVLPVIPGVDAPDALPACPSLRGQPCRAALGAPQPSAVTAVVNGQDATVTWTPPATRPDLTVESYKITEQPGGATKTVDAGATTLALASATPLSAQFTGLASGPHFFTVEALYAQGGTSGPSTPSNSVTALAAQESTTTTTTVAPLNAAEATTTTTAPDEFDDEFDDDFTDDFTDDFSDDSFDDFSSSDDFSDPCLFTDPGTDFSDPSVDGTSIDPMSFDDGFDDLAPDPSELFGDDYDYDPFALSQQESGSTTTTSTTVAEETTTTTFDDFSDDFTDDTFDDFSDDTFDDFSDDSFDDFSDPCASSGSLAFSGTNGNETTYAAGVLLCVGGLLVLLTRRPRATSGRRS